MLRENEHAKNSINGTPQRIVPAHCDCFEGQFQGHALESETFSGNRSVTNRG